MTLTSLITGSRIDSFGLRFAQRTIAVPSDCDMRRVALVRFVAQSTRSYTKYTVLAARRKRRTPDRRFFAIIRSCGRGEDVAVIHLQVAAFSDHCDLTAVSASKSTCSSTER